MVMAKQTSENRVSRIEDEDKRLAYLHAMDIPVWQLRDRPQHVVDEVVSVAESEIDVSTTQCAAIASSAVERPVAVNLDWKALQQQVASCSACELHQSRTQTVFGVGDHHADLLVIGEAPGEEEETQGVPFVGPAGQLFDAMLKAIDLDRNKVFITNALKCRPPEDRDPKSTETVSCRSFLIHQIKLVQPKLILAVGRVAAHDLLQINTAIGKLRGLLQKMPDSDVPVLVTYHPAYLLRTPREKAKSWEDLKQVVLHLDRFS